MVVRRDLPTGTALAQTVHAAGETSPGNLPDHTYAVVLAAEHEEALLKLELRLQLAGIPHKVIREPDSPWNNQAMAIGIVPCGRSTVRKVLSHLPLYR